MLTINNAEIFDGTGRPGVSGSVVVDGDCVVESGPRVKPRGNVIDADGLALVPGFIDLHSHSDVPLWIDGRALSKISQGITTEVVGNCGMSAAPLYGPMIDELGRVFSRYGCDLPFTTMGGYLSGIDGRAAVNVAALLGHGTLRRGLMGDGDRKPTPAELTAMANAVRHAMAEGAFGISTGLIYPPGCYAATQEIVALARAMASYRGIYFTHMRSEGDGLVDAVKEALTIGREAGVSVQISHHKAMGPVNWGKTATTLDLIDGAIQEGQDVWLDQYPYEASATGLSALLPKWAMAGGNEAVLRRLADRDTRMRIMNETDAVESRFGWDRTRIGTVSNLQSQWMQGRSLQEIAAIWSLSPIETLIRVLEENAMHVSMIRFGIGEEDIKRVLSHPRTLIGTDGSAMAPDGPYAQARPHPRTYGTFPRVLRWFVREKQWLSFEQAIYRMTGLSAFRLGLSDRGVIRPGAKADLVLLDRHRVADKATYAEPHQFSEGIVQVWVNGVSVWRDGTFSGNTPGRGLRHVG